MEHTLRASSNHEERIDSQYDNDEPMPKIGIYLRVSTQAQELQQQEDEIKLLSRIYNLNLTNAVRYEEHGKSAFKPKYYRIQDRPTGKEMWADIHSGIIDAVVILEPDRCWRHGVTGVSEAEYLTMPKEEGGAGIKLMCALGGCTAVDLTTSSGFSAFWGAMGSAQHEVMQTRERVMRKQKFNQSIGKAVTGKVFGWDKDENGFIIPNYDQLAVLAFFKKETEGRWGKKPTDVAWKLNDLGVHTANHAKNPDAKWVGGTLERQLKNNTHLNHARSLQTRDVKHPILGKVRIGFKEVVRADCIKRIAEEAKQAQSWA